MSLGHLNLIISHRIGIENEHWKAVCGYGYISDLCDKVELQRFEEISGSFRGFNRSLELTSLPPDSLTYEIISFTV